MNKTISFTQTSWLCIQVLYVSVNTMIKYCDKVNATPMASSFGKTETFLLLALLILLLHLWRKIRITPTQNTKIINWPILGMLPGLLRQVHHMHDSITETLRESGGTFCFQGPWFANVDTVCTCDPANINHILSKNFSNYPKGPDFKEIFDSLGDGIFNADSELWGIQRKTTMSLINHTKFVKFLESVIWRKVEQGLVPILKHVSESGQEVDLQEQILKFFHDTSCKLMLGFDPFTYSVDSMHVPSENAFVIAEEAAFYRHVFPMRIWKIQRWLNIGIEKKVKRAMATLDHFVSHQISLKRLEISKDAPQQYDDHQDFDLIRSFMDLYKGINTTNPSATSDKFLKDAILSLLFAARDTTGASMTWFFYLVATNPIVQSKIREEIKTQFDLEGRKGLFGANLDCFKKLVYLHAALCESLRLYPPVPVQHKAAVQEDILPTGHVIPKNKKLIISFYSVGRMESVWGEDCLEFKPERWISEQGGIKHVPSSKFLAFNAGPRSCLGKEMAFIQMKIVAASIIYHYHIKMVEGQIITPSKSVVLHMKYGLKVRFVKANDLVNRVH